MSQKWADADTANCVWLFQVKKYIITNRDELDCLDRKDIIYKLLDHTKSIREIIDCVKEYEKEGVYPSSLVELEDDCWHTEAVFLCREEARAYGQSRPCAWGEENVGWQIYGVPLHGVAIHLLSSAGVNQEYINSFKESK